MLSSEETNNQNIAITMREMWKVVKFPTKNKQINNTLVTNDFTSKFYQLLTKRWHQMF